MSRAICTLLLFTVSACAIENPLAQEPDNLITEPGQIGESTGLAFSLLRCAAIAARTEAPDYQDQMKPLFESGHKELVRFISSAQALDPKSEEMKAAGKKVPMIITSNLGGPNPDFMAGRIWAAVELYVDDELTGRSTWTHQKTDPQSTNLTDEMIAGLAEQAFREQNCALLRR